MTKGAFTLVELMIAIAIVATLAAIAIPRYASYSTNARLVEPELTVDALWPLAVAAYEDGFFGAHVMGWDTGLVPRDEADLDKSPVAWSERPAGAAMFKEIGYEPTGATRCTYQLYGSPSGVGLNTLCDLNGDGIRFGYGLTYAPGNYWGVANCSEIWPSPMPLDELMTWRDPWELKGWDNQIVHHHVPCR